MLDTVLHWLGYGLCHQLPARSFIAGGHQLPVCARDTGIYLGFVVSYLVIVLLDRGRRRGDMPEWWVLALGALGVAAMAWDGVTSYAGLRETTNILRLATGYMTGFAMPLVVVPLVSSQLWRRSEPGRVLEAPWEAAVWLAALPVAFAGTLWGGPAVGTLYALLTAAAIIATFTAVNLIIVLLAPRFERRSDRLRDAWLPLLIAVAMTFAEIAATAWVRGFLLSLVGYR
ncbi:MAG: DUF2085 domain-containing protein [Coriobacteriia bacterium]|nr:DUF2085 domain-containing protein [Coriobacteriia bacterium]